MWIVNNFWDISNLVKVKIYTKDICMYVCNCLPYYLALFHIDTKVSQFKYVCMYVALRITCNILQQI